MMLNTTKVLFKDGKMACYTLNTSSCGSSKILQESMRKKKGKFDAFRAACETKTLTGEAACLYRRGPSPIELMRIIYICLYNLP